MLRHHHQSAVTPSRVVIVGAGGFVGQATSKNLLARGVSVLGIARGELDLLSGQAAATLAGTFRETDTLVMIAAQAPVKNNVMLIDNLKMMDTVCAALSLVPVSHVVYISSDAVYADADIPLSETSCAQPASLHGVMHLAREVMLVETCKGPFCILRPTLIYGASDPHNGYGPNRFRRLAEQGREIVLFGEGEERRDHVYIDDVAEIVSRCIFHRSEGTLNIATGRVTSFRDIAEKVAAIAGVAPVIKGSRRVGTTPHRGYRAFDASSSAQAFPDFTYTSLEEGLALSRSEEFCHGRD